jgi:hypothetical protein
MWINRFHHSHPGKYAAVCPATLPHFARVIVADSELSSANVDPTWAIYQHVQSAPTPMPPMDARPVRSPDACFVSSTWFPQVMTAEATGRRHADPLRRIDVSCAPRGFPIDLGLLTIDASDTGP